MFWGTPRLHALNIYMVEFGLHFSDASKRVFKVLIFIEELQRSFWSGHHVGI
jgi:hypothetical protein